jgi:5-carboxymethyl-2-hydroxymuconate isomerase
MSHLTLEYSANLRAEGRFGELCRQLAQFMTALRLEGAAVFSVSGAGFVHAILKIGAGRSDAAKQATCAGLFAIMKMHFAEQFDKQGLALSLELNEFSEAGTLKHNNLHARLKRP